MNGHLLFNMPFFSLFSVLLLVLFNSILYWNVKVPIDIKVSTTKRIERCLGEGLDIFDSFVVVVAFLVGKNSLVAQKKWWQKIFIGKLYKSSLMAMVDRMRLNTFDVNSLEEKFLFLKKMNYIEHGVQREFLHNIESNNKWEWVYVLFKPV